MSDMEIRRGNVSFLRKPKKLRPVDGTAIRRSNLKSFSLRKGALEGRKAEVLSKTFSKGLVKSLLHRK